MKKILSSIAGWALCAVSFAQNSNSGTIGLYGPANAAATTFNTGGNATIGIGGNWAMAGAIIATAKGNPGTPSNTTDAITLDGGTITGNGTTVGGVTNVVDGYIITTVNNTQTSLPLGNASLAYYPLTVTAGTALKAAYFDGTTISGNPKAVSGSSDYTQATVFNQFYDVPVFAANSYALSYPAGLTSGNNAILYSTDGNTFSLGSKIAAIATTASTTAATTLAGTTPTRMYLSSSAIALPITIVSFTGVKITAYNALQWSVTNASNFSSFQLQRSDAANASFITIAGVPYQNGVTGYSYKDYTASGDASYRLKLVDLDGTVSYSAIVFIPGNTTNSLFAVSKIYPNPTTNVLNISLYAPTATKVIYIMVDVLGRIVKQEEAGVISGANTKQIDVSNFNKGTYILTIKNASGVIETKKITKL